MVGRELFGDSKKFWNPDLPEDGSYQELVAAGERQVHNLIEHAHRRGLETNNYADITQFPPEFAPLLKDAQKVRQLGQLMVVPGASTPVDDPRYRDLCTAVLKTIIETYPETDLITISIPEWRQWTAVYEDAWKVLDAKYGLSGVLSLADALEAGRNRKWFRGPEGWKKSLDEVKGRPGQSGVLRRPAGKSGTAARLNRRPQANHVLGHGGGTVAPVGQDSSARHRSRPDAGQFPDPRPEAPGNLRHLPHDGGRGRSASHAGRRQRRSDAPDYDFGRP